MTQLRSGDGVDEGQPHRTAGAGKAHPWFASWYPKAAAANDRSGFARFRQELLAGLSGEVVEIGPGSGLNFPHYPAEVARVVAVEPEPRLREMATQEAARAQDAAGTGLRITVVGGIAEDLPLPDGGVDAVVVSLALCSVSDQRAALTEALRVLRPGGEFRFLEHVRALGGVGALAQRTLDATVWPLIGGGCRCSRRTDQAVADAGFELVAVRRFGFPDARFTLRPTAPHVIGRAIRPLA
jgi:SAM-dependent methyltransferase